MKKRFLSMLLALAMLIAATACNPQERERVQDVEDDDYSRVYKMIAALSSGNESEEKETSYFRDDGGRIGERLEFASDESSSFSALTSSAAGERDSFSGANYSNTNNQVEGVQESDIVKTDGNYIFIASRSSSVMSPNGEYAFTEGRVSVIKANDGNMETFAQIKLDNAEPRELLLYNGKLIIISERNEFLEASLTGRQIWSSWYGGWSKSDVIVTVYDINGDFSAPLSSYSQDGYYTSSRMIDNNIYLITNFNPPLYGEFDEDELDCYIPSFGVNGAQRFVPANAIILPEKLDYVQYAVIGGLDVNKSDMSVSVKANLGAANLVYSSLDNIYAIGYSYEQTVAWYGETYTVIDKFSINKGMVEFVDSAKLKGSANNQFHFDEHKGTLRVVTEVWGWEGGVTPSDPPKEPEMPETPQYISEYPEYPEYPGGYPDFPDTEEGQREYEEWQWAYDEWNRETHEEWSKKYEEWNRQYNQWFEQYYNQEEWDAYYDAIQKWSEGWGLQGATLFTLDSDMNVLAQIHGIGKGENVQSVRFMGDIGYIVTFMNTDPLFSFDLSDPRNPVQLDELKIPGFSRYMHPWNNGLLLGMGVEAEEEFGMRTGLKLSMFDVSDNENLSERHVYVIGDSASEITDNEVRWGRNSWYSSPVEWEHKAALVSPEKNIIGYPYSYSFTRNNVYINESYYAIFSYDENGFKLIGEIKIPNDSYGYSYNEFSRGLYIGDYVYAISNDLIVSAALNGDSIVEVQRLSL
ncbi:MAG: beta-propeller domain-containing protein [Oscillospiraceae bacterium]|nr:beta-propeller domain-containing protein [Oscillospiraceae bacterium]